MKTSLNKEINNIRNVALSAYLMAFFTNAYYKEAQELQQIAEENKLFNFAKQR